MVSEYSHIPLIPGKWD